MKYFEFIILVKELKNTLNDLTTEYTKLVNVVNKVDSQIKELEDNNNNLKKKT
jgi:uncharacterized protein YdcH (DUF465 family)